MNNDDKYAEPAPHSEIKTRIATCRYCEMLILLNEQQEWEHANFNGTLCRDRLRDLDDHPI